MKKVVISGRLDTDFNIVEVMEAGFDFHKEMATHNDGEMVELSVDFDVTAWELEEDQLTVRGAMKAFMIPDKVLNANTKVETERFNSTFLKIHDPEVIIDRN